MTSGNAETLRSYGEHVQDYIEGTSHQVFGASQRWLDASVEALPTSSRLLELGSAFGRDAAYLQAKGYRVDCSDAVAEFVSHLTARGFSARHLDLLADEMPGPYDLILANAVLLHFTAGECALVLRKICRALAPDGRFAFSLKAGQGEEWSDKKLGAPRYFRYWTADELPPLLRQAGFDQWDIVAEATERSHANWLYVLARVGSIPLE